MEIRIMKDSQKSTKDATASDVKAIVMQPTMELRWQQVYTRTKGIPSATLPGWPECGPDLFELEQKWVCLNTGKEEWRKVEVA